MKQTTGLFSIQRVQCRIVMFAINVAANSVPHCPSHQHVGEKVISSSIARYSNGRCQSVSGNTNKRPVLAILLSDHRGDGPCGNSVAGRKSAATVEELSA